MNIQNKQDWNTPIKYAELIHKFFDNNLELDPCSNLDSIIIAKEKIILPKDGLQDVDWSDYKTIYINPPYGRDYERKTSIKDWFKKAYNTHLCFGIEILMLVPVATNTSHWKEYVFGKATSICFLNDTKLVFRINNNENNKGSPMACAMIYYGLRYTNFKNTFSDSGYIIL
jgi:hypothetical protein